MLYDTGQFWSVPFPDTQSEWVYLPPTKERAVARSHSTRQAGRRTSSHLGRFCECRVAWVYGQGHTSGRTARIYPASMCRLRVFRDSALQNPGSHPRGAASLGRFSRASQCGALRYTWIADSLREGSSSRLLRHGPVSAMTCLHLWRCLPAKLLRWCHQVVVAGRNLMLKSLVGGTTRTRGSHAS